MSADSMVKKNNRGFTAARLVYYICGILEVLLAFRLVFKLMGANPGSSFVSFIYSTSQIFLVLFNSIFRTTATKGIETTSVLEPATIIAMIVYGLIAWGIVKLFTILKEKN